MRVYLDFETFWDSSGYTLKKLSVEEYVRDPRFEVLLLSLAVDDEKVYTFDRPETIRRALEYLPVRRPDVFVFVQNYQFDGFILPPDTPEILVSPKFVCTPGWGLKSCSKTGRVMND